MPTEHEIWKAIEEYLKSKCSLLQYSIDTMNVLEYSNISEEIIKKTGCGKTQFDKIFGKMKKQGEIIPLTVSGDVYVLKGTKVKRAKMTPNTILTSLIGFYVLFIIVGFYAIATNAKLEPLPTLLLLLLGSLSMIIGNKIISIWEKTSEYAKNLGKTYELPLNIIKYFILLSILISSAYYISTSLLIGKTDITSGEILTVIGIAITGAVAIPLIQIRFSPKS